MHFRLLELLEQIRGDLGVISDEQLQGLLSTSNHDNGGADSH
jgi:hypothetical protein